MHEARIEMRPANGTVKPLIDKLTSAIEERCNDLIRQGCSRRQVMEDPYANLLKDNLAEIHRTGMLPVIIIEEVR